MKAVKAQTIADVRDRILGSFLGFAAVDSAGLTRGLLTAAEALVGARIFEPTDIGARFYNGAGIPTQQARSARRNPGLFGDSVTHHRQPATRPTGLDFVLTALVVGLFFRDDEKCATEALFPHWVCGRMGEPRRIAGAQIARAIQLVCTQLELALGLGGSLRLGLNPGELLDFLLGWLTIDLYDDDIEWKKWRSAVGALHASDLAGTNCRASYQGGSPLMYTSIMWKGGKRESPQCNPVNAAFYE